MAGKGDVQAGGAFVRLFLKDELTRNLKKTMESAGKTMMIAGSAIVGPMVMAVKAAGDLEATVAKLGEVFKGRTPDVQAWGDELASQIGRSKREVYDFLSATQDLFIPLGFDPTEAEKMSKQLTQLTYDLGSFNNRADADVSRDLQAALTGSGEVMKKYGVIVSEAAVKQELLNQGMDPSKATDQQKVQARLNIIMRGTTAAQGDAARTTGEFGNRMKALRGMVADVSAEIATTLLPLAKVLIGAATQLVTTTGEWARTNKQLVMTLAVVGAGLLTTGVALIGVAKAIGIVTASMAFLYAHPVVAGLAVVAATVALIQIALWRAQAAAQAKLQAMRDLSKEAANEHRQAKEMRAEDQDRMKRLEALTQLQDELGSLTTEQTEEAQGIVKLLTERYGDLGLSVDSTTGKIGGTAGAMSKMVDVMKEMAAIELDKQMRALQAELIAIEKQADEFATKGIMTAMFGGVKGTKAELDAVAAQYAQVTAELIAMTEARDRLARGEMDSVTGESASGGMKPEEQADLDRLEKVAEFNERLNERIRNMALQRIADVEKRELAALDVKHRQDMLALEELKASEEDKAKLQQVYERERFDLQTEHANRRAEDDKKRLKDEAEKAKSEAEKEAKKRQQAIESAPKQMSNISGMFRASAIAAAGRGASPEQKNLDELKGIRKDTTAQRRLAQRQALAAERLNVALTHG